MQGLAFSVGDGAKYQSAHWNPTLFKTDTTAHRASSLMQIRLRRKPSVLVIINVLRQEQAWLKLCHNQRSSM